MKEFTTNETLQNNPLWIKLVEIKGRPLNHDDFPMIDFFLKQMEHTRKQKFQIKEFRSELESQLTGIYNIPESKIKKGELIGIPKLNDGE